MISSIWLERSADKLTAASSINKLMSSVSGAKVFIPCAELLSLVLALGT